MLWTETRLRRSKDEGVMARKRALTVLTATALLAWAASVLTLTFTSPAIAATSHEFKTAFSGSGTDALSGPADVAVDNSSGHSTGDIYVADTGNHRIEKFSPTGEFILMFGKEVNETKVKATAPVAEQNVCTAASGDRCQAGTTASTPPGSFETPAFVAVDNSPGPSSGDVYVGDTGDNTVSKFNEEGHLTSAWGSNGDLEGSPAEAFGPLAGITVDGSGNLFVYSTDERMFRFESSGDFVTSFLTTFESDFGVRREIAQSGISVDAQENLYKVTTSGIYGIPGYIAKMNESGLSLFRTAEENPTGLAIDVATNDLYVDAGGGSISHFLDGGQTFANSFGSSHLENAQGISVDTASEVVYAADTGANQVTVFSPFVLPTIELTEPTAIEPTSITVDGHINPGTGNGTTVTNCYFEYGYTSSFGLGSMPCSPSTPFDNPSAVSAKLSNIAQGVHYHYRLVADNERGESLYSPEAVVSGAQEPTIEGVYTSQVKATSANLSAKINPEGRETSYRFEYGTSTAYGTSSPETNIGAGSTAVPVTLHVEGLESGLTYHFRVVASNSEGTNSSEDQTFGFYPSACPNELLRQQTGSDSLPDCRAYELVSPSEAGNTVIFPQAGPSSAYATNPPRIIFAGAWGVIPDSGGEPSNTYDDLYASTRTNTGWVTRYVGLPSSTADVLGGQPELQTYEESGPLTGEPGVMVNPSLSELVDWNDGHPPWAGEYTRAGPGEGASWAPYVWNTSTGKLVDRWPTDLGVVAGGEGFNGEQITSSDLHHYIFGSNIIFSPGGVPGDIYDDDTSTDEISIASRTSMGEIIEGAEPLQASSDGSHILMTVGGGLCGGVLQLAPVCGTGQLYMRIGDAVTYEIAPKHVVNYLGMAAGGSEIFITSAEELIEGEDTHGNTELYMWSQRGAEEGDPLTLISKPNGGTDTSTACNASWTSNCDTVPVNFIPYGEDYEGEVTGRGGNSISDSYIASEAGDIYFLSPALLDGTKGVEGLENLYFYHQGTIQYVTTLSSGGISRIEVSPDGSHMAFFTRSQITGFSNAGYSEAYEFTPGTGRITCASCNPDGEPPTHETYGSQDGLFMTNDGRTFFFTENALVSNDTDNSEDVYEYVNGRPRLITAGTGQAQFGSEGYIGNLALPGLIGVSANGTDVYFATTDVLVGQDLNGQELKIYDARTDGGFPFNGQQPQCAAADECHGPLSAVPTNPGYGATVDLGAGGNADSTGMTKKTPRRRHIRRRRGSGKVHALRGHKRGRRHLHAKGQGGTPVMRGRESTR